MVGVRCSPTEFTEHTEFGSVGYYPTEYAEFTEPLTEMSSHGFHRFTQILRVRCSPTEFTEYTEFGSVGGVSKLPYSKKITKP